MTTITISPSLIKEKDLILIPRRRYEGFLELEKIIPILKATKSEATIIKRGEKEIQNGAYVSWKKLKHDMARSRN